MVLVFLCHENFIWDRNSAQALGIASGSYELALKYSKGEKSIW